MTPLLPSGTWAKSLFMAQYHFKSLRVYNLTASGLDSLSVYKYCTDTGRHFPPFLPGKGRGQCAAFPPLHLLICTAEVTVLAKSHLPVKLHLRWQFVLSYFNGEILLGKLTLISYNLKYKHLLSVIKYIRYQPKQMPPALIHCVSLEALTPQKKGVILSL